GRIGAGMRLFDGGLDVRRLFAQRFIPIQHPVNRILGNVGFVEVSSELYVRQLFVRTKDSRDRRSLLKGFLVKVCRCRTVSIVAGQLNRRRLFWVIPIDRTTVNRWPW